LRLCQFGPEDDFAWSDHEASDVDGGDGISNLAKAGFRRARKKPSSLGGPDVGSQASGRGSAGGADTYDYASSSSPESSSDSEEEGRPAVVVGEAAEIASGPPLALPLHYGGYIFAAARAFVKDHDVLLPASVLAGSLMVQARGRQLPSGRGAVAFLLAWARKGNACRQELHRAQPVTDGEVAGAFHELQLALGDA
jgi:hypothetical protein